MQSPIQTPPSQQKNYIFKYDLKQKKMSGFQAACDSVQQVQTLRISDLESEAVRSSWIKFTNSRNDRILNQVQEGKWVLRFPKGSEALNQAWLRLVDLVTTDKLWDIKASAKSTQHDTQVICVYITDSFNIEEVISVYDILVKSGILRLHMEQAINANSINYITDTNTASTPPDKKVTVSFTDADITELHRLYQNKNSDEYQKKWSVLAAALKLKISACEPLNAETVTYFSTDEVAQRQQLLGKIEQYQISNNTSNHEPLSKIIKDLRQSLTGNYRFKTLELLDVAKNLLVAHQPERSFFSSTFSKDPISVAFKDAIQFVDILIREQSARVHTPYKGPQPAINNNPQKQPQP